MAEENAGWDAPRIHEELAELGYKGSALVLGT
jgi:hypothetical protein